MDSVTLLVTLVCTFILGIVTARQTLGAVLQLMSRTPAPVPVPVRPSQPQGANHHAAQS